LESEALKVEDLQDLNIDTTVQEKNITFPTDVKLLHKVRELLVKAAEKENGLKIKKKLEKIQQKKFDKSQPLCSCQAV